MRSDQHFHEIFHSHPEWLFDLLGQPAPANCCFTSPVIKAVQRQLDGYLIGDKWPPTIIEFQMWSDALIYPRVAMELAQVHMDVHPQVPVAYIIFASAELDKRTEPWSKIVRALHLDVELQRLRQAHPDHLLLSVLFPLLEADETKLVEEGPVHYRRIQTAAESQESRDVLLRVVTDFLFQRLPHFTHAQITKMMKWTPLEETEGYKSLVRDSLARGVAEGLSQGLSLGLSRGLIRMIHRRFPEADGELDEVIGQLDYLRLEQLAEAMFDFPNLQALRDWLGAGA